MRAILIDPVAHSVSEVDYDGNYKSVYKLIDADTFDIVSVGGHSLYVDDNGLYKQDQHFFSIGNYPQPIAGKALLLGQKETEDGINSDAATAPLADVVAAVEWQDDIEFDRIDTKSATIDHPLLGPGVGYIRQTPVFRKKRSIGHEGRGTTDEALHRSAASAHEAVERSAKEGDDDAA